jgi:hypothetical protein
MSQVRQYDRQLQEGVAATRQTVEVIDKKEESKE